MKTFTAYPSNPVLKKYIAYFYFVKTDSPAHKSSFYCFPKNSTPLSINKNVKHKFTDDGMTAVSTNNDNYVTTVLGMFRKPFLIKESGAVDEVTIVFKPGGLNNFITQPYYKIAPNSAQVFNEWDSADYTNFLEKFFTKKNFNAKTFLLEEFLLTRYKPFKEHKILDEIIDHLDNIESNKPVSEIAAKLGWNEKKLYRFFTQNMGISPVGYRMIAKFRHSLKNKIYSNEVKKFTSLGYESSFYDQSYFIKTYKKLTGQSPKNFFEAIEKLADKKFILQKISR